MNLLGLTVVAKKIILFLLLFSLLIGVGFGAKKPARSKKTTKVKAPTINPQQKKINNLNKEIKRLKKKLKTTKSKSDRQEINRRISSYQAQVKILSSKATGPSRIIVVPKEVSFEAVPEEIMGSLEAEEKVEQVNIEDYYKKSLFEVGANIGLFGGGMAYLGEVRFPLRFIIFTGKASCRLATGLTYNKDGDHRFIPLNLDFILNYPPGRLTGTYNYVGAGLNYVMLTSGRVPGTVGGQVFYGVESEGFGGTVFGELGYALVRSGFFPSQRGVTVMVGFRKNWSI